MKESAFFLSAMGVLLVVGVLWPFWGAAALAVMLSALLGHPLFALGAALLIDLLWGAPPGMFEALMLPFVLLALISMSIRILAKRYFFPKSALRLY